MSKAQEALNFLKNLLWWCDNEKQKLIDEHAKVLQECVDSFNEDKVEISKDFILLKPTPYEMFNTHTCPRCKTRSVFNFNGERNNFCGNCGKKLNWRK